MFVARAERATWPGAHVVCKRGDEGEVLIRTEDFAHPSASVASDTMERRYFFSSRRIPRESYTNNALTGFLA